MLEGEIRNLPGFVYPFYRGNADDSEHVLYIVGKTFSIGIQRR